MYRKQLIALQKVIRYYTKRMRYKVLKRNQTNNSTVKVGKGSFELKVYYGAPHCVSHFSALSGQFFLLSVVIPCYTLSKECTIIFRAPGNNSALALSPVSSQPGDKATLYGNAEWVDTRVSRNFESHLLIRDMALLVSPMQGSHLFAMSVAHAL